MGSTESRGGSAIDHDYRLVRRFVSDFYCSEITVIEHKRSKELLALREVVQQANSQTLAGELESRKGLSHRNVVRLKNYWIQNDLGMCSNMARLQVLFEYHEETLEDVMSEQRQPWEDAEAVDMVRQVISGLAFLQRKGVYSLLAGPKSIMIGEQQRASDDFGTNMRRNGLSEVYDRQRCSLADLSRRPNRLNSSSERLSSNRCYKLFDPFEAITCTKSTYTLESHMQVPLHPEVLAKSSENLLPDSLIKLQNTQTVAMLGVALCLGCDVFDLDIYRNGRLSPQMLRSTVEGLQESHPRFSTEIVRLFKRGRRQSEPLLQPFKIKALPFWRRDSAEVVIGGQQRVQAVPKVMSRKRLSLLQVGG